MHVENNPLVSPRNTPLTIGRTTYYFRTRFDLPFAATNAVATITHRTDDGAVFYLNGREVQRVRMPAVPLPVSYATLATASPASGDAINAESWTLSRMSLTNLVPGTNLLAVEVHQNLSFSDDIVFGCSVTWTFTNSPPVIVAQPTDVVVLDGRPASLVAVVDGHPAPKVQWLKDGVPIPGATNAPLQISTAKLTDSGAYWLVASNGFGVITSSKAHLHVQADLDPPTVLMARAQKDLTNVTVFFSEPVRSVTATNPGNFTLFQSASPSNHVGVLNVSSAGSSAVTLHTSPRIPGLNYTLRISGIQDTSSISNQIASDTEVSPIYEVELFAMDAAAGWNYFQSSGEPETNWFETDYDESFWVVGTALFHGGNPSLPITNIVRTPLAISNNGVSIPTYYFRTRFDAPGPIVPASLRVHHLVDDGIVVHLNGREVHSMGMPTNRPTTHTQTASRTVTVASHEPPLSSPGFSLAFTNQPDDGNVLAAEIHQSPTGALDIAFGLRLDGDVSRFYPRLLLAAPSTTEEGSGTLLDAGNLSLLEPLETNLVVRLHSTRPGDISLPAEIIVPAGLTNVTFGLFVHENTSLEGPRHIYLRAEHPGFYSSTVMMRVVDNETNRVELIVPTSISEGNGTLPAELRLAQPAQQPVSVSLTSSDLSELTTPSSIIIPAGETSTTFDVIVKNDDLLDGPQAVTLIATVAGWSPAATAVTVNDDEPRTIAISLPVRVLESAGILVATGRVQLAGIAVADLTVQLNSSHPDLLSVVSNLTILAGQSNAFFDVTMIDNPLPELPRNVIISAAITEFQTRSRSVTVLDDDAHTFTFEHIPSPQYTNVSFLVRIKAMAPDGSVQTNFNKNTALTAAGQSGAVLLQPSSTGAFGSGQWTGMVQVATTDRFVRLETMTAPGISDPFHVEPVPWKSVGLLAEELVFDPGRQRIYASVSSSGGIYSNSVVAIDPARAEIIWSLPVGEIMRSTLQVKYRSGKLALSDDGQFLYVAVSNAYAIQRVNLDGPALGPVFPVGAGVFVDPFSVADMVVLPGAPKTLAVARANTYNAQGVAIYDDGVRRPDTTTTSPSVNALEPAPDATTLYGYDNQSSGFGFTRLSVSPSGVTVLDSTQRWLEGFDADIVSDSGFVFGSLGAVIDATIPKLLGRFELESSYPACCKNVAPDVSMRRAFFLMVDAKQFHLRAYDIDTFLPLRALDFASDGGGGKSLIRCGTNGLAFISTAGRVYIVRSSLLTEPGPSANVGVTQAEPTSAVTLSNYTITLTVSNQGPETATEVVLKDTWPTNHAFVSATVSAGSWSTNAGKLIWTLGMLPSGSNATVLLTLRSRIGGWFTNRAVVVGNESDSMLTNNLSSSRYFVQIDTPPDSVSHLIHPANDVAFDPHSQKLLVSAPSRAGSSGNSVQLLDPTGGLVTNSIFVGNEPGRFALSDDHQLLYVTANSNQTVSRIHLPTQDVTLQFNLGTNAVNKPYSVEDMAVLPGQPQSLAISRQVQFPSSFSHESIAIYDNGIVRNSLGTSPSTYFSDIIEFGADASMLFEYNNGFHRLSVNSEGVSYLDSDLDLLRAYVPVELEFAEGLLYSTSGLVVDPFTRAQVGQVSGIMSAAALLYDPLSRRMFYLHTGGTNYQLLAFEAGSLIPLGSMNLWGVSGSPSSLTRWGKDGFAFRTSIDQLFILRSSLVPSEAPADLMTVAAVSSTPVTVNSNFTYSITVSNSGPNTASNVIAYHKLPATTVFVSGNSTVGVPSFSNSVVRCAFGTLTNGESVRIQIVARTPVGGTVESFTTVASSAIDPNMENNAVRLTVPAEFILLPNSIRQIAADTRDIVYNPQLGRIYASTSSNSIVVLNPSFGSVESTFVTPTSPGLLRLTANCDALYCTLNFGRNVARLSTASGSINFEVSTDSSISDLEPIPGMPNSFVISRLEADTGSDLVEVYDDVVPRTKSFWGARDLEFGSNTNEVYGVGKSAAGWDQYRAMTLNSDGIIGTAWNGNFYTLGRLAFDGGILFASTGEILHPPTGAVLNRIVGPGANSLVQPDMDSQRVFFLNQSGAGWSLDSYEPHTQALIGSMPISNVLGTPSSLLRWGADGFAFRTSSNQLFLGRSALIPFEAPADLALTQRANSDPVLLGSNVIFILSVTNSGPVAASNVVLLDRFPTNTVFVSANGSQGGVTISSNLLTWSIGTLTNGASRELQLTVKSTAGGFIANVAAVTSGQLDPDPANNSSTLETQIQLNLGPNASGTIALQTTDLAYDSSSGLLYATLSDYFNSQWENAVVSIDPSTGSLGEPMRLGKPLSKLAAAEDGRLYLLANGGDEFLRVNPVSRLVELTRTNLPWRAADIKPVPGLPDSVVVIKKSGLDGSEVMVFDNSIPRPQSVIWFDDAEFYAANQMLGFDHGPSLTGAARLGLTSSGISVLSQSVPDLIDGTLSVSGGLIYTSGGSVVDPATLTRTPRFGVIGPVAPDAALDRVAFLTGMGSTRMLRVFDTNNRFEWGFLTISNLFGTVERLIRCGEDRFAFRTSDGQVVIVRSSALPIGSPAELALGTTPTTLTGTVGQTIELVITATNHGPVPATALVLTNLVPPGMRLQNASSSHGSTTLNVRELRWEIGGLEAGAFATNQVALIPARPGLFSGVAVLRSNNRETNSANNVTHLTWRIHGSPTPSALSEWNIRASDLVWDPSSQRLFMSLPSDAPGFSNSVVLLDPVTGLFQAPFEVGPNPGKLAVSDNGQYLYAGLNANASVVRVKLATPWEKLIFPLNTGYQARDMKVLPSQPATVAIAREYFPDSNGGMGQPAGVALYEDGVERQVTTQSIVEPSTSITCSTNPARLYGYNGWSSEAGFRRMDVSANGVSQLSATPGLISGSARTIQFAAGLVFASSGTVLQPEALTIVTNIPDISTNALCQPDIASGLLTFLTERGNAWYLRQYVHSNYALQRQIRIPGVLGQPRSLTCWGDNGLAFLTSSNQLFLVQPSMAGVDLVIQPCHWPTQAIAGQAFSLSLSVSNGGFSFEPDAVVTNVIPRQTTLASTQVSQGSILMVSNRVIWFVGAIDPAATASFTLTMQTSNTVNTTLTNTATVDGAFPDAAPTNNRATSILMSLADTDRDALPDDWELIWNLNPTNALDALWDSDCDGQSNLQEYQAGSNPFQFDSVRLTNPRINANGNIEMNVHGALGKAYHLETSSNLTSWTVLRTLVVRTSDQPIEITRDSANVMSLFRLRADTSEPVPLLEVANPNSLSVQPPILRIIAQPGHSYTLRVSSNLVNWSVLTNFLSTSCSSLVEDSLGAGAEQRYYSVSEP